MVPGASSLPPKATEESKKRFVLPKANVETRKTGRRLVRPRLGKPEEPQGDREMSEAEGSQIGSKPGPSSDTEAQSNVTPSSQPMARKRVAATSTSELHDESVVPGENNPDLVALSVKKSKGSDSPQESAEGQAAATPELTGGQPITQESFDGGELLQGQNEEVMEAQNEELLHELQESRQREDGARQRSDTIILQLTRQFEEQNKLIEDMRHRSLWSRVKTAFGVAAS